MTAPSSLILNSPFTVSDRHFRFPNDKTLVLEIKGQDSPQNRAKRSALVVRVDAVNAKAGFGAWAADVAFAPGELRDIFDRHALGMT